MTKRLRKIERLKVPYILSLEDSSQHPVSYFSTFQRANTPCLLKNCMRSWKALRRWRAPWDYLCDKVGDDCFIDVACVEEGEFSGANREQQYIQMSIREFVLVSEEWAKNGFQIYMAQCPIVSHKSSLEQSGLSILIEDIKPPRFIERIDEVNLWMNIIPTVSSYHYDSYHGLLCVVSGVKKVRLHNPGSFIKSESLFKEWYNHPLKHVEICSYEVQVKRGDILYIPEGWWHYIDSTPDTLAVSIWWYGVDQQLMVQGNLYTEQGSQLDIYHCRNTLRRLSLKYIQRKIRKILKRTVPQ